MQIQSQGNNELTITGNIKTIEDGIEIKKALDGLQRSGVKGIQIKIVNSFSITSTVIGHLMKLVNLDQVHISMTVGDRRLYRLLEDLSLVQSFNVRQAG